MCIFPSPGRRGWFFSLKCVWQHHSQFLLNFIQRASPEPNTQKPGLLDYCIWNCRYSRLPSITVEMVGSEISWNCGDTMATGGWFTRGSATITELLQWHLQADHDKKPWPRNSAKLLCLCAPGVANRIHIAHPLPSPIYPLSPAVIKSRRGVQSVELLRHTAPKQPPIRLTADNCTVNNSDPCFQQVMHQFGATVLTKGI